MHPVCISRNEKTTPIWINKYMAKNNIGENHTGKKYGILTVLEKLDKTAYNGKSRVYLCKCECGNFKEVPTACFSSVKSCGCLFEAQKKKMGDVAKISAIKRTLPNKQSTINSIITVYKRSASKRGYEYNLTDDQFKSLIFKDCYYCGCSPNQLKSNSNREDSKLMTNGIDRLDNTIGYTQENCVTCCKVCNRAKDTMELGVFLDWVSRVYLFQGRNETNALS
jgi:hypothetical protein